MPEYVTTAELLAVIGANADPGRVAQCVDAANAVVAYWCPQLPVGDPPVAPDAPVTPITKEAAWEAAHAFYRAQVAVGGVYGIEELIARLPADRVKPIRDLLDVHTQVWGLA